MFLADRPVRDDQLGRARAGLRPYCVGRFGLDEVETGEHLALREIAEGEGLSDHMFEVLVGRPLPYPTNDGKVANVIRLFD
jgi:hypothetical protein